MKFSSRKKLYKSNLLIAQECAFVSTLISIKGMHLFLRKYKFHVIVVFIQFLAQLHEREPIKISDSEELGI